MHYLTEGGSVVSASEESPAGTTVPPKNNAEDLGERLMDTAHNMADDMGISTTALIAIIVGKYTFST
jgi:hypothetical protein